MNIKEITVNNSVKIGGNRPLTILAGPCVLEEEKIYRPVIETMTKICQKLGLQYVFKSSFDKANRSSINSFRGPSIEEAKNTFKKIREEFNVPIITDIHENKHPEIFKDVVDYFQIPAFLCRQTDLLIAAGNSGKAVNIKKGQFMAPSDMNNVIDKFISTGNHHLSLCERGSSFGYHNLVVDMRSLKIMRDFSYPVVFDATHSIQLPGASGNTSSGQPEFILPLAKAATAIGIDALFLEVHPNPKEAKSDGANSLALDQVENFLTIISKIHHLNQS